MTAKHYDVVIVGGGVSGTALLYTLARYTDIASVALVEKADALAQVNSSLQANSQTLHCGDIETNYSLDKARQVKRIASMIVNYADVVPEARQALHVFPKMVVGVGEQEVDYLRERHRRFAEDFPYMALWNAERIAALEPEVALVNGQLRPEPLLASGVTDRVSTVDFAALTSSFVRQAQSEPRHTHIQLSTEVQAITQGEAGYTVTTSQGTLHAGAVVVAAGPYSLLFAQRLGYGLEYSMLPVAGSFYFARKQLNGKVYTVQNDKLPFAAVHGDPDLSAPGLTRIGPTALILPKMERYSPGTYWDFLKTFRPNSAVAKVFWNLFKDPDIRAYMIRNMLFELPWLGKRLFLADARKIIPSLRREDLTYATGYGGIRPQIINRNEGRLQLGEATINPGTGIIFNLTPSPGASTCLGNAYRDAAYLADYLGKRLDRDRLVNELLDEHDLD